MMEKKSSEKIEENSCRCLSPYYVVFLRCHYDVRTYYYYRVILLRIHICAVLKVVSRFPLLLKKIVVLQMKFAGLCELLDRYPLVLIPISYIIYRLSRTFFAILRALFLYRIVPIFYTPNLDKYANRWTGLFNPIANLFNELL